MALQAGTILKFGITTPLTTYGLLQDFDIDNIVKRAEAIAPDGQIVSIQEFGERAILDLTYIPLVAGTGLPEIGTTFSFDLLSWKIDSISNGLRVAGFKTVNLIATNYPQVSFL